MSRPCLLHLSWRCWGLRLGCSRAQAAGGLGWSAGLVLLGGGFASKAWGGADRLREREAPRGGGHHGLPVQDLPVLQQAQGGDGLSRHPLQRHRGWCRRFCEDVERSSDSSTQSICYHTCPVCALTNCPMPPAIYNHGQQNEDEVLIQFEGAWTTRIYYM